MHVTKDCNLCAAYSHLVLGMLSINLYSCFKNKTKMHVAKCICNNDFQQILREETCLLLSYVEAAFLYTIMHVCVFPHKLFSTMHNVDDAICTIN